MTAIVKDKIKNIRDLLSQENFRKQIVMGAPRHLTPDRVTRLTMTTVYRNPKLAECSIESLLGCVLTCTQLGLEPDSVSGRAYLIPYGNQCTLIIGYKGLMELARRSGQIQTLEARIVHEKDVFDYEYGTEAKLRHRPATINEPGEIIAAYAIARMKDGGDQFEVMSRRQIEDIRQRSKAAQSGPWITDYAEMAKKTVMRRLCKYLPSSAELAQAVAIDEQADAGLPQFVEPISVTSESESRTKQLAEHLDRSSPSESQPVKRKPGRPRKKVDSTKAKDAINMFHRLSEEDRTRIKGNFGIKIIGEITEWTDATTLNDLMIAMQELSPAAVE